MFNDNRIHIDFDNSTTPQEATITHIRKPVDGVLSMEIDDTLEGFTEVKLILQDMVLGNLGDSVGSTYLFDPLDGKLKRVEVP